MVLVSAVLAALACAVAWLSPSYYRGETRLLVEAPSAGEAEEGPAAGNEEDVAAAIEAIRSGEMLRNVAARLDLARSPEFNEAAGLSFTSKMLILAGLKADPSGEPVEDRMVEGIRRDLDVFGAENARVVVIEFSSQDPRLAAAVPNALADAYVAGQGGPATQSAAPPPDLSALTTEVEEAEARLAEARAGAGPATGADPGRLSQLAAELDETRAGREELDPLAQALRDVAEEGASAEALPPNLPAGPLTELVDRRSGLTDEVAELSMTLLDNHPRMRAARAQLAEVDAQIRAEARKALAATEAEIAAAAQREEQLAAQMARLQAPSSPAQEQPAELQALERDAELARERLASARRAAIPAGVAADSRIFARAIVPSEPYFPRMLPIAGIAFAASLMALGLIETLRNTRSRASRRSNAAVAPILPPQEESLVSEEAMQAALRPEAEAAALEPEGQPATEPALRQADASEDFAQIEALEGSGLGEVGVESAAERLIAGGATRAVFVSPEGDEAAATAVLVAREIADAGLRVLLIDLTASGAASRPMLDSTSLPGITNLMAAEAQFTDVVHNDNYSDCHVMPAGTADPARAMRAADRLPMIMDSLTTAYDIVIVECGPADAEAIRRLVSHGSEILVSVIEPDEEVAIAADALVAGGYDNLTLVTPAGYRFPNVPGPDRTAA